MSFKKVSYLFLFFFSSLFAHSIVFVHVGSSLPSHIFTTISQARLFNKECPIYLIASRSALRNGQESLKKYKIEAVPYESLERSPKHYEFACGRHDRGGENFWIYTSERFFYLQEFVSAKNLHDVFHLENDVMIYVDVKDLLPVLHTYYRGMIAATFEHDRRCVAGFVYISDPYPLVKLMETFPTSISIDKTDMETLARFKDQYHKIYIDHLPIVCREFAFDHALSAPLFRESKEVPSFSNHIEDFNAVFDAAAFGVYLAGWDAKFHAESNPGEISPNCVFNPSYFSIDWKRDEEGRRIPFVTYNGKTYRLNNLHITNKGHLPEFHSL